MAALDWHDARHFDRTRDLPCRWCGRPTPLRDEIRRPSHKVCAEHRTAQPAVTAPAPPGALTAPATLPSAPTLPEESPVSPIHIALELASWGLPVLPLREGKLPVGNCRHCKDNTCGGRPNMKDPGLCGCPAPCHGWAAATNDPADIKSGPWERAWAEAAAVAYHPGAAGLTVVDLDSPEAVAWARVHLPATVTVATDRGEHWVYRGAMRSANAVRPGIDIKSRMAYARWLGYGSGTLADLPDAVLALAATEETTPALSGGGVVPSVSRPGWSRTGTPGCRHNERFVRTGLDRGIARIRAHRTGGAGSAAFGAARFLASQHAYCPGPGCLDSAAQHLVEAAVSVGVPLDYAARAVTRGLNT